MKFIDSYRAQYYVSSLKKGIARLETLFKTHLSIQCDIGTIIDQIGTQIAKELDKILLPTIAFEIHKAKKKGLLKGNSPEEKYISFFVEKNNYTKQAQDFINTYPFLFEMVDTLIDNSCENIASAIHRLKRDAKDVENILLINNPLYIQSINILDNSDCHCKQQALILSYSDGKKLVYKPVEIQSDIILSDFINSLGLEHPFDQKTRKTISKKGYGWIEFIEYEKCEDIGQVQDYYYRIGTLLAILNAMNYSDGHQENILASKSQPVILDCETLFQFYHLNALDKKNILSTLLIQKLTKDYDQKFLISGLQGPPGKKYRTFNPYSIDDKTDNIKVSLSGFSNDEHHNYPILHGVTQRAHEFVDKIEKGFRYAYDLISKKSNNLLGNQTFWNKISNVKSRVVVRETTKYFYLLRRIQQPDLCTSRTKAFEFIRKKLKNSVFSEYELNDLLGLNIPYFYHKPGELLVYDSAGNSYEGLIEISAIDFMKRQLAEMSESKKEMNCKFIRKYLKPIEKVVYQ